MEQFFEQNWLFVVLFLVIGIAVWLWERYKRPLPPPKKMTDEEWEKYSDMQW